MFSTTDQFGAMPFWQNGPAPGSLYNFPNIQQANKLPIQRSQAPVTTTSSIVAVKFNGGVLIAGDMLGSYGSLARYRNCPRIFKVNHNIILGAGGDYGDFQYVKDMIDQKIIDEECLDDGFTLKPKSLYCWLTRIMYNRRSKFDPFWNNFVVGGMQDGVPFLGTIDKLGTAYEDNAICTGYASQLALPMIRDYMEKNPSPSKEEVIQLVHKCMEVLFYRDARSYPKYQRSILTSEGIEMEGPLEVHQNWRIATFAKN